jgi:ABC-2 type transport system ATP-binding protein
MGGENGSAPAIRTEGLTKKFGDFTALDSLTLDVAPGEVFGFLGPNGAGKSTTLRLLLGLIKPSAGKAEINGIDVSRTIDVHHHLAYVPGDVSLWPRLTGEECLELFARLQGGVDESYRAELIERFELDVTKRARTYSKGNRQKVALVAAFSRRPSVLLLDEPTSGLDPLMEQQFRTCVHEASERGQTIFLSSHILSEVEELCARVGILRTGELVEVAAVDSLRQMHTTELEIDFAGEPPDLSMLEGVEITARTPNGVRLKLTGSPAPVLDAIHGFGVTGLRSHEASLEEIFLAYYGGGTEAGLTDDDGTT